MRVKHKANNRKASIYTRIQKNTEIGYGIFCRHFPGLPGAQIGAFISPANLNGTYSTFKPPLKCCGPNDLWAKCVGDKLVAITTLQYLSICQLQEARARGNRQLAMRQNAFGQNVQNGRKCIEFLIFSLFCSFSFLFFSIFSPHAYLSWFIVLCFYIPLQL